MFHRVLGSAAILGVASLIIFNGIKEEAPKEEAPGTVIFIPTSETKAEKPMTKAEAIQEVIEEPVAVVEMKFNDIPLTENEQRVVREIARYTGIDYRFAYALIDSESEFIWQEGDHHLVHPAIGYFQISTVNQERLKKDYGLDIYDPYDNLEAGMRIIQELSEKYKDGYGAYDTETAVIMCYKCGESRGKELMDEGFILEVVQTIKDKKADFDL